MFNFKQIKVSLELRTLLLTILIVTGVLTVSDKLYNVRSVKALEDEIGEQTTVASRRLAKDLKRSTRETLPALFNRNLDKILELVPNIIRLDVYINENNTLRLIASNLNPLERKPEELELNAFQKRESDTYMIEEENSPGHIMAIKFFYLADNTPAVVTVFSSLKPVVDLTKVQTSIRLYSQVISVLLLVLGITFIFRTTVYRSMRHLIKTMNAFQAGDSSIRAQEQLPGEFRELAKHLNLMLCELSRFHDNMKLKINEATTALAKRNQELEGLNLLLYATQKRLLQAERFALIGQLTATFAHEVGSPLSAVSTHLQILLEKGDLDPAIRDRVQLLDSEINRICGIVENLLSDTRRSISRVPVDVIEALRKAHQLLGPTLQSHNVRFEIKGESGPLILLGNPDQLQQLFLNLFNNSLDAIPGEGHIQVTVSRSRGDQEERGWIQIMIQDSGTGIPADKLEHIFEPFFTTKEIGKGTGLGLAVSQEIVRQHGGIISLDSPAGEGAIFTLRFPEFSAGLEETRALPGLEAKT